MTNKEKCELILIKYPETKFNRATFFWRYLEEFYEVKFYITKTEFYSFWKDFWGLERTLRDVLKLPEFKLKPEQNSKRYQKAKQFQQQYANGNLFKK